MLTLVRDGLPHSPWPVRNLSSSVPSGDFLGIKVHLRSTTLSLLNLYVSPFRSSPDSPSMPPFDPSLLPSSPSTFIFGDFNAHHPAWDAQHHGDSLGAEVYSWLLSSHLEVLNDPCSPPFSKPLLARGHPLTLVLAHPL